MYFQLFMKTFGIFIWNRSVVLVLAFIYRKGIKKISSQILKLILLPLKCAWQILSYKCNLKLWFAVILLLLFYSSIWFQYIDVSTNLRASLRHRQPTVLNQPNELGWAKRLKRVAQARQLSSEVRTSLHVSLISMTRWRS